MSRPPVLAWLSWEVIFKLLLIGAAVFGGVKIDTIGTLVTQVKQDTQQVKQETQQVKQETQQVREVTEANRETLSAHEDLTETNAQLLRTIRPLFQDIVQRQHDILMAVAAVQQAARVVQDASQHIGEELDRSSPMLTEVLTHQQALLEEHGDLQRRGDVLLQRLDALTTALHDRCGLPSPTTKDQ